MQIPIHWQQRTLRLCIFLVCLIPLAYLVWGVVTNDLGANPAEYLIRSTGLWTLRFLCITLAVTPLRQGLRWTTLARWRRMLGLFAFFYACLHAFAYTWLDVAFSANEIVADILKRPFILVGFLTLLILLVLASTSPHRVVRRLGAKRWKAVHRAVYVAALLALLHFYWMKTGKNNFEQVQIYAVIIGVLLGWRVIYAWRQRLYKCTPTP